MSPAPRALVLLNAAARAGRARVLWSGVEAKVRSLYAFHLEPVEAADWAVMEALRAGTRCFLAAGGDGTVHALVNALLSAGAPLSECTIGAVGLGSSNDFHKPLAAGAGSVPLRLDLAAAEVRDVGLATFTDRDGRRGRRAFLISGSMGAVAAANHIFNRRGGLHGLVKARSTHGAILLAASCAIAGHRNLPARLRLDGRWHDTALSSFSVLKTPHLAGCFTYDTDVTAGDGRFAVNLCEDMNRGELVRALAGLACGRFAGRPKTRQWSAKSVFAVFREPVPLELDGELYTARSVEFDLLRQALRVCG
jgi:diacylglycerol kinase (ATP)